MATISEIRADDGSTLLRLAGGLTYDSVAAVARPLDAAVSAGGTVVVSLADVAIVTTPGISLLLAAHQRLSVAGGRLVLAAVPKNLRDLLRRCRLDRVFTLVAEEPAVGAAMGSTGTPGIAPGH